MFVQILEKKIKNSSQDLRILLTLQCFHNEAVNSTKVFVLFVCLSQMWVLKALILFLSRNTCYSVWAKNLETGNTPLGVIPHICGCTLIKNEALLCVTECLCSVNSLHKEPHPTVF